MCSCAAGGQHRRALFCWLTERGGVDGTAFIRQFATRCGSTLPRGCHEPADWGGTGRNDGEDGGIELPLSLQPDAKQVRISQRVSRIRSASLRFPPPPLIFYCNVGTLVSGTACVATVSPCRSSICTALLRTSGDRCE